MLNLIINYNSGNIHSIVHQILAQIAIPFRSHQVVNIVDSQYSKCWYTLSEAWSRVNWADLMAAQGAFGTDFYDSPKHRAYYRYGRPVLKIGPKSAPGSHEIRLIHSASSLGQCIPTWASLFEQHSPLLPSSLSSTEYPYLFVGILS